MMKQNTDKTAELWSAVVGGKSMLLKQLIDEGVNINLKDEQGWTPLMVAILEGHPRCVQVLLEANADLKARQEHGLTAVKLAEAVGHLEISVLMDQHVNLLEKKATQKKESHLKATNAGVKNKNEGQKKEEMALPVFSKKVKEGFKKKDFNPSKGSSGYKKPNQSDVKRSGSNKPKH